MTLSNETTSTNLESKAFDAIFAFLDKDEDTSIYLEAAMEELGWDSTKAYTEADMEAYALQLATIKMKLLAKFILVL